jgi:ribosomal protein S12 methylthiotransferase
MADGAILPYLDIPFQHASKKILKAMKRPGNRDRVLERISSWREVCPELVIRSTFIVGFPGETDADFDELLDFLEIAQLDRVGCFTYSAVDGAAANALFNHVPEAIKQERYHRFMLKQQAISAARLQQRIGQQVTVLIESRSKQGYSGRCYADAPEIDGLVHVCSETRLPLGEFCRVKITGADEYDLYATPSR